MIKYHNDPDEFRNEVVESMNPKRRIKNIFVFYTDPTPAWIEKLDQYFNGFCEIFCLQYDDFKDIADEMGIQKSDCPVYVAMKNGSSVNIYQYPNDGIITIMKSIEKDLFG